MELAQLSGERALAGWCCSGWGGEGRRDVSGFCFLDSAAGAVEGNCCGQREKVLRR